MALPTQEVVDSPFFKQAMTDLFKTSAKCPICGKFKEKHHDSPWNVEKKECWDCKSMRIARERALRLLALSRLPLEERISNIEKWIEDYRPPRTSPFLID